MRSIPFKMRVFIVNCFMIGLGFRLIMQAFAEDSEGKFKVLQKKVFSECSKNHPLEKDVIKDIVNNVKIPDDGNTKCWLSCTLKKMGVMKEGWKIDWETCRIQTKLALIKLEDKAKVDKLANYCKEEVSKEEPNDCELAYKAAKCKLEHWKEYGLPQNIWKE